MLESARHEWHCFRDDRPGRRFANHHERAHRSPSKARRAARIAVGAALLAGGVVLLFIPGPGLLVMLFGVALVAGESKRLASLLDRAELRTRRWWKHASKPARVGVVGAAALVAAAVLAFMAWRFFF